MREIILFIGALILSSCQNTKEIKINIYCVWSFKKIYSNKAFWNSEPSLFGPQLNDKSFGQINYLTPSILYSSDQFL